MQSGSPSRDVPGEAPILSVRDIRVHFKVKGKGRLPWAPARTLKAVDGVSFDLRAGETLGVVGESGCGKSTLSRAILNLIPATHGEIVWMGRSLANASARDWHAVRRDVQMIFQDPLASLDPRMTVGQIIAEPLREHRRELSKEETSRRVRAMMAKVGLREQMINRYAHEFSGGQCQRIGIARALIIEPKLIVCDEPVSALDVSIQAQIVNLLKSLQQEMQLAVIFIAHDLAVVKHIADRVMVMYLGHVMELAGKHALYADPRHPYTRALLSAVPIPDPAIERNKVVQILGNDIPSPINPPSGCVFHTRCPRAEARCSVEVPLLRQVAPDDAAACHFA
ncbi:MAG: murein tripeptide/oligopeptide ABC transporter ATP binding protein OppF [Janthinobacterium lividum]